jgi:hypothetical protein
LPRPYRCGLRDLVVRHRVAVGDVVGTRDAGDGQHAYFVIDAHLLRSADQQVALGQDFGDHRRDRQVQLLRAVDRACALRRRCGAAADVGGGLARLVVHAETAPAETEGERALAAGLFRTAADIVELRLVVDVDGDRDDVADLARPHVLEQALVLLAPQ